PPRRLERAAGGDVRDDRDRDPADRRSGRDRDVGDAPRAVQHRPLAPLYFLKRETQIFGEEHMAEHITDVTDTSFQAEVLESDTPVLVDFWAPWCGPCRVVAPALEEIAGERDDLRIVKLNVDDNQQTAAQYQVLAIPTMILFRNGQEAKRIQGAMPKKRLVS